MIDTNDSSPFALGKWTDLPTLGAKQPQWRVPTQKLKAPPNQGVDPLLHHIDQFGKLAANFNNLQMWPTDVGPSTNWDIDEILSVLQASIHTQFEHI